ncbi:acyl-CoA dehydrogenase family protein [Sinorhizobium medicae]|uniref:acyl-CoA dehydrogenase family protein n=1 Tax=Sinorhizobium medicae TaxID=110321 RepID=UPI000FDC867F|nr:acyl-CoA dehydrogenase family protein [Sinorhizobium medicae]RVO73534.1 acyl-CoA dehydrogenase [Sinorhizobium medicae]
MDFGLTEQQIAIRTVARNFATREIVPKAQNIDETADFDWSLYRGMAALGFIGMTAPEEYGGSGTDLLTWSLVMEEVAKASSAMANSMTLAESMVQYISSQGTEAQKATYLPEMVRGERICAFALTEPDAGSDAASISTTAVRDGDCVVLSGQKMFISGAALADLFVIVATVDKSLGAKGIRSYIVERDTPGLQVAAKLDLLGVRGFGTAPVFLDNCRVPASSQLGGDGGFRDVMNALDGAARLGATTMAVGLAQAAMEASLRYAGERSQFGQPLSRFQAIQIMLADMSTEIEAARLLLYKAATRRDTGLPSTMESSHAKLFAADMCMRSVTNAMQIFGGYAYSKEYPVERFYRDAKIHQIWDGTSQIQRTIIARSLLRDGASS